MFKTIDTLQRNLFNTVLTQQNNALRSPREGSQLKLHHRFVGGCTKSPPRFSQKQLFPI